MGAIQAVRVPAIADVATALRIYYSKPELENKDIGELFSGVSKSKIRNLKKPVLSYMAENGILCYGGSSVNTEAAFSVWGLDIADLERRHKALKRLGVA